MDLLRLPPNWAGQEASGPTADLSHLLELDSHRAGPNEKQTLYLKDTVADLYLKIHKDLRQNFRNAGLASIIPPLSTNERPAKIVPGLLLSSQSVACNAAALLNFNVKVILPVLHAEDMAGNWNAYNHGRLAADMDGNWRGINFRGIASATAGARKYMTQKSSATKPEGQPFSVLPPIGVRDSSTATLFTGDRNEVFLLADNATFKTAFHSFVDGVNVLVHCSAGQNRSVAVLVSLLLVLLSPAAALNNTLGYKGKRAKEKTLNMILQTREGEVSANILGDHVAGGVVGVKEVIEHLALTRGHAILSNTFFLAQIIQVAEQLGYVLPRTDDRDVATDEDDRRAQMILAEQLGLAVE